MNSAFIGNLHFSHSRVFNNEQNWNPAFEYSQTCTCGHLHYAVTCIEMSPVYCTIIENIIWIEPLLRGHLSHMATCSLSQRWSLNTGLTVVLFISAVISYILTSQSYRYYLYIWTSQSYWYYLYIWTSQSYWYYLYLWTSQSYIYYLYIWTSQSYRYYLYIWTSQSYRYYLYIWTSQSYWYYLYIWTSQSYRYYLYIWTSQSYGYYLYIWTSQSYRYYVYLWTSQSYRNYLVYIIVFPTWGLPARNNIRVK
jgi:hypothetical protein